MKITSLHIQNFKSIRDFKIDNPAPFTVFVGANGVGKSNLFEALELRQYIFYYSFGALNLFGKTSDMLPYAIQQKDRAAYTSIQIHFEAFHTRISIEHIQQRDGEYATHVIRGNYLPTQGSIKEMSDELKKSFGERYQGELEQFYTNFSRIFIGNQKLVKVNVADDSKLNIDGSNLEKVLKRILKSEAIKEEFLEWLSLFIPEFKDIQVHSDNISGTDTLLLYEKNSSRPFTKNLISDGTYNILCLLTAVYQSESPQFLCLEEPENGLNPYVVKELVGFFRHQCEEKGHYIWLNTHSQTLVNQVSPEELIVLNKVNGQTVPRQFSSEDLQGISMDEAWLTNVLGGGIPW